MNHTYEAPTSSAASEPKLESEQEVKLVSLGAKLGIFHVGHALLVGAHAVAVVAAVKGWFITVAATNAASIQTEVTAVLQGAFLIIVGGLVSLVREFAVDENIQHPPTLGVLHLRLNAWSGLFSALSANWLYFRSTAHFTPPDPSGLKTIMFYLACGTLLQVSSGAILTLAVNLNASPTKLSFPGQPVYLASRFGDFDEIWPSTILNDDSVTSFNPNQLSPATRNAANAALNMFPVRPNHTRYPGLQGRLLHDLVNQDNLENPFGNRENTWTEARVQATLVNIHCSQIEDATVNTFTLPLGSTDMSLAQPSPRDGSESFIFRNISDLATSAAWVNVSMPKPPYWDPDLPGLNIVGYWGSYNTSLILPTKVYFQPWAWASDSVLINGPPGHNQVVMVIATQRLGAFLVDSAGNPGAMVNLSQYQGPQSSDGGHGGQAYIQVIGCTAINEDLTATIDPEGRLLDPPSRADTMIGFEGPHGDHTWDQFQWGNTKGGSQAERQLLLALTPSSPAYNNTVPQGASTPTPESLLADLLDGSAPSFSFIGTSIQRNALVTFQGALERLFASYLWNVNTLCTPPSVASTKWPAIQPSLQGCPEYSFFATEVDLEVVIPAGFALAVVKWRAIASLVSCLLMWLIGSTFINMKRRRIQHADGLLDSARILGRGSKIPEVVAEETLRLDSKKNQRRELFNSVLMKRLSYVEDDGIGGYLNIDDSGTDFIPPQN